MGVAVGIVSLADPVSERLRVGKDVRADAGAIKRPTVKDDVEFVRRASVSDEQLTILATHSFAPI